MDARISAPSRSPCGPRGLWFGHVLSLLLLVALGMAWVGWPLTELPIVSRAMAVLGVLALSVLAGHPASPIQRAPRWVFALGSAVLIALVRGVWILSVATLPASDFETYHRAAVAMADGSNQVPEFFQGGFPAFLGLVYRVFGSDLLVAKLLNVTLSVAAGLLLLELGTRLLGARASRAAVVLFAFWPAQVMMTSVVATETPYVVLLLAALVVFFRAASVPTFSLWRFLAAGALLGASSLVRPVSLVVGGIAVVWLLLERRESVLRRLRCAAAFMAGFMAVTILYQPVVSTRPGSNLPLYIAFNVLTGTNGRAGGTWSLDDDTLFKQVLSANGAEKTPGIISRVVWERIHSDPAAFGRLMVQKFKTMWADDLYGAYWSTVELDGGQMASVLTSNRTTLYLVSQVFYVGLLTMAIVGCVRLRRGPVDFGIVLLVAVIPVFAGLHVLLDVQSRYHHPWTLVLLILAGYGATWPFGTATVSSGSALASRPH